jgi:hypothetical protein
LPSTISQGKRYYLTDYLVAKKLSLFELRLFQVFCQKILFVFLSEREIFENYRDYE